MVDTFGRERWMLLGGTMDIFGGAMEARRIGILFLDERGRETFFLVFYQ